MKHLLNKPSRLRAFAPSRLRAFAPSRLRAFAPSALALVFSFIAYGQQIISGTVTDENGLPLPGATVLIENTSRGVNADFDGNYQIQAIQGETLTFSFVGYATKNITIGASFTIDVQLISENLLDEIVVVGYGSQSRKSLVGSLDVVSSESLSRIKATSIGQALQGNISGVNVINSGGIPGTNPIIRIRGINSVNADASPLIIVDGAPYNGNINNISQDQIKSISVLKDASTTAIYGSRGSNGVILVTTKKGKWNTKPSISLKTRYGFNDSAVELHETLSLNNWSKLSWEASKNKFQYIDGLTESDAKSNASTNFVSKLGYNPYGVPEPINSDGNIVSDPKWDSDWKDAILDSGTLQEHSFSLGGGSDKTAYYFNLNYFKEDGNVKTTFFERTSARTSIKSKVNDFITTDMNLSFTNSYQNAPSQSGSSFTSTIQWIYNVPNYYPIYQRDGNGNLILDGQNNKIYDYGAGDSNQLLNSTRPIFENENALGVLNNYKENYERTSFFGGGSINVNITDFLSFTTKFSYEHYLYDEFNYIHNEFGFASSVGGRITQERNTTTTMNSIQSLDFKKSFDKHNLSVVAVYEAYQHKFDYLESQGTGFLPNVFVLNGSTTPEDVGGYINEERLNSYLARFNYSYNDIYFLEGAFRSDGSTRFDEEVRWGEFYSVGGAWVMSNEKFIKNITFIDFLKFKASYGEIGNNRGIGFFPYQQLFDVGWNQLDTTGVLSQTVADSHLTWETTSSFNIGFDFGLFNNKFNGTIEFYNKESIDLILDKPLPISTGNDEITTNIGSIKNYGFEFKFNGLILKKEDLQWTADLNFSLDENEILELTQEEILNGSKKWKVGRSLYDFFIREYAGVDPNDGYAMWYKDITDNEGNPTGERETTKEYSDATRYYQDKESLPDVIGGFSSSLNYKNFDFYMLFNFSFGAYVLDGEYQALMGSFENIGRQGHKDLLNRWQKPGDITDVPLMLESQNDFNSRSTRFLFKNDYVRLKALTLGYSFDKEVIERLNLKRLRLFIQGDNLITFQSHDGIDPEQNLSGTTNSRSYQTKSLSLGVNIEF